MADELPNGIDSQTALQLIAWQIALRSAQAWMVSPTANSHKPEEITEKLIELYRQAYNGIKTGAHYHLSDSDSATK